MLDGEVGLVPGEVGGHAHLLQPGLPALPAEEDDEVGGRGDHVGHAAHQIAPAVAVVVHRVLEVVRGQELRLAELAGPGADHLARASGRRGR